MESPRFNMLLGGGKEHFLILTIHNLNQKSVGGYKLKYIKYKTKYLNMRKIINNR
jgi:hypothetical protein